jgi:hypothetical protein
VAHRGPVARQLQQLALSLRPARVVGRASASHTVPTGLPGTAPPGPAMPVTATARCTGARFSAPSAIASATGSLTAPCARSSASGTPSSSDLAALL